MKREMRAPVIHLLTMSETADQLGVTGADVERLVDTGRLHAVTVSRQGGHRFWPADVQTLEARQDWAEVAAVRAPLEISPDPIEAAIAPPPPHRVRPLGPITPAGPRWSRFEPTQPRTASTYLAFRDADHVTRYLKARNLLELEGSASVHGGHRDLSGSAVLV